MSVCYASIEINNGTLQKHNLQSTERRSTLKKIKDEFPTYLFLESIGFFYSQA